MYVCMCWGANVAGTRYTHTEKKIYNIKAGSLKIVSHGKTLVSASGFSKNWFGAQYAVCVFVCVCFAESSICKRQQEGEHTSYKQKGFAQQKAFCASQHTNALSNKHMHTIYTYIHKSAGTYTHTPTYTQLNAFTIVYVRQFIRMDYTLTLKILCACLCAT